MQNISARTRRGIFRRRFLLAACGLAAAGGGAAFAVSAMAAATTGPGTVTVTPATVTAGAANTKLQFAYQAGASSFSGKVSVTVPVGWAAPQTSASSSSGFVLVGKGSCTSVGKPTVSGSGPWVVTTTASCPASGAFPITYGPFVAPTRVGSSTFTVAANTGTATPLPLAVQPVVTVGPNVASSLVISGAPNTGVAGVPAPFTVTAYDAYGNVATGYAGTVNVSSSDTRAIVPAPYAFTAADKGVHAFSIAWLTAATENIAVKDTVASTLWTTKSGVVVAPAAASTITIGPLSTGTVAGTSRTFAATVSDAYGNKATNYTGTVKASSTDAQAVLPGAYTFTSGGSGKDNGAHTFSVALRSAGTQTVTLADTAVPAVTGTSPAATVTNAPATALRATMPASATAGVPAALTVTAVDAFGNRAADARTTIHVTSSDATATLPADYTLTAADAGARTLSATFKKAGTQNVTFADKAGKVTSAVAPLPVAPAALGTLTLTASPAGPVAAGTPVAFTALGFDAYGNALGDRTSAAAFSVAPNGTCAGATCTMTAADSASSTHAVTAAIGAVKAVAPIKVVPAAIDHIALVRTGSGAVVAGTPAAFVTTGFDAFGNGLGAQAATLTISPDGSCAAASCTATVADAAGASHVVTAAVGSLTASTSYAVVPAGLDHLVVSGQATASAGTAATFTSEGFDAFGNTLGDTTAQATFAASPEGTCQAAACTMTGADRDGSRHTVSATVGSASGSASVIVGAAGLDHLVVTPASPSAAAGSPVAVRAEGFDRFGNSVGDRTDDADFSIAPEGSCDAAACSGTAAAAHVVTASVDGATGTADLAITPAGLDHLAVTSTAASVAAGTPVTFHADGFDAYGNRIGDRTAAATFTIAPDGSCSGASCSATAADHGDGAHTVTATIGTATGTAALVVVPSSLDHLVVTVPANATAGAATAARAEGFDAYGNSVGDRTSEATFAVVPDGTCDGAACTVTAADRNGSHHTVSASVGPAAGSAPVVVAPAGFDHLVVTAGAPSAPAGSPFGVRAEGFDRFGNSVGDRTSDATFTIAPDGSCDAAACSATAAAPHTVTGAVGDATGTADVTVTPAGLDHVLVAGPSTLAAGQGEAFTAAAFDAYGNGLGDVTGSASFAIAPDGSCAAASCSATVADSGASAHTVAATVNGIVGTLPVTVAPGATDHMAVTATSSSVVAGTPVGLSVRTFDAYGNDLGDATAAATFSVSPDGSCTGAACTITVADTAASSHTVTARIGSMSAQVSVTATRGVLARLAVARTGTGSLLPGIGATFTARGFDASGNDLGDQTAAATFSIAPDGSCTGPVCVAALADVTSSAHVVTATVDGISGTVADPIDPDGHFHVVGTKVIGPDGRPFTVRGVNRSAFTYTATGWAESWNNYMQMKGWGANAVRITLSPHFWLPSMCTYDPRYVASIDQAVTWAETLQMLVILDDHWSTQNRTCGTNFAGQQKMADDLSVTFLTQLVNRYKDHPYVAFDLYNEPHDISNAVWRNGGMVDGWHAVGMQTLLDTVRATGATNLVFASGNAWANDISLVLDQPLANDKDVVYAIHAYPIYCNGPVSNLVPYLCEGKVVPPFLDKLDAPVILKRAVVMTEFGTQRSTATDNTNTIAWAEAHGIGWMAWVWGAGSPADYNLLTDMTTFAPNVAGKPVRDAMWAARGWTTPFGK